MAEASNFPIASPEQVKPPSVARRVPSIPVRLLCWIGVYVVGMAPLWSDIVSLRSVICYPLGLLGALVTIFPALNHFEDQYVPDLTFIPTITMLYGIYLIHLAASLWVTSWKAFCALMFGLLVMVAIDTIGLYQIIHLSVD